MRKLFGCCQLLLVVEMNQNVFQQRVALLSNVTLPCQADTDHSIKTRRWA